eukprot:m.335328 g.335328  ORF g.335328 m.335328 type:complete len:390 (+) comp17569_c0_seq1:256-1425(+)
MTETVSINNNILTDNSDGLDNNICTVKMKKKDYSVEFFKEEFSNLYKVEEEVFGIGQAYPVRACVHKATGKTYALKMLPYSSGACREIYMHTRCHEHPSVPTVEHVFLEDTVPWSKSLTQGMKPISSPFNNQTKSTKWVLMVMEAVRGPELFKKLTSSPFGRVSEELMKAVIYQLADVLEYCHARGVMHRDVKLENVIFETSDPSCQKIRLADFGSASDEPIGVAYSASYIAPEMLKSLEEAHKIRVNCGVHDYDSGVDMWSLGVTLYTCLGGITPFYSQRRRRQKEIPSDMRHSIEKGIYTFPTKYFESTSHDALEVVCQLLCTEPTKRITAEQLKNHPWVKPHKQRDCIMKQREEDSDDEDDADESSDAQDSDESGVWIPLDTKDGP